jgi:acetyltransferase-like isoleucine patch superfamily enzyme
MQKKENILIIGNGRLLKLATEIANEFSNLNTLQLSINKSEYFHFSIESLKYFPKEQWLIVIAIDDHAINYSRKSLFTKLALYGYKFHNLVSKSCFISESVKLMPGLIVCPGVTISSNCSIGIGCILEYNSFIDSETRIQNFSYIKTNAKIGRNTIINSGTTIGENVTIGNSINIGKHCELLLISNYQDDIPDRMYFDSNFPNGMIIR